MKQEISPRIIGIAIAVVVMIVGMIAWKMFTRPKQAHIVFHAGAGEVPANVGEAKARFGKEMMRTGRSPDAYTQPAAQGGQ